MGLGDEYKKLLADKILVHIDDLTDNERILIEESFYLLQNKLRDIKLLEEDIYRLNIELRNLKSMKDDKDY